MKRLHLTPNMPVYAPSDTHLHTTDLHVWTHKAEEGSMDGGTTSDILFIPFLVALLMFGLLFALVGFWRVGASYATQRSAQVGSVDPDQGNSTLSAIWHGWSSSDPTSAGFNLEAHNRSVRANIGTGIDQPNPMFGNQQFGLTAQTRTRSERFYPGGPICSGGQCDE
jgi:hypothetical protein